MTLTVYEVSKIFELVEPCKGNIAEIARQYAKKYEDAISTFAIRTCLIKRKYKLNSHGGRRVSLDSKKRGPLKGEEIKEVFVDYFLFDGNAKRASKTKGKYGNTTYLRYWKIFGLKINTPGSSGLNLFLEDRVEGEN